MSQGSRWRGAGQACCLVAAVIVFAPQAHTADAAKSKRWVTPRTADGQPDLQGIWTSATLTRLERPEQFGDRLVLTAEEAAKIEGSEAAYVADRAKPTDLDKAQPNCVNFQFGCGYNMFWIDRGSQVITVNGEKRSSVLVDPPNGKIPPLTPERQKFLAQRRGAHGSFDGPEARPLSDRCLLAFGSSSGPPMLPVLYNNHYQIVQTRDHIMIMVEMVHDARIVRLGSTHVPADVRKWMGDSVGHWEGDTLVVETTRFTDYEGFRGATPNVVITERFTRSGPDTIDYRFKVDDPQAFTRSFSGELPFNRTDEPIYEYACHEGNYALPGILAGAREDEKSGVVAVKPRGEAETE
jgi:hypothetical protein